MLNLSRAIADLSAVCLRIGSSREDAFTRLDHALRDYPGHRLFTILEIEWARHRSQRVYSSKPTAYPCGGAKPLRPESGFYQEVVVGRRARICADHAACRDAFPDFAVLEALGCGSAINVPLRSNGLTIGSMNLLHQDGWYRQEMTSTLLLFAAIAASILSPDYSRGRQP